LLDKKIENTTIEKSDKGIKISLENIQFMPDLAKFFDSEKEKLNKISEILKKYKNKNIMIVGHTTDKRSEEFRQKLSVARAKVIAEYLIGEGAIDKSKTTFVGKGGKEPIADNNTEIGMQKNRRVFLKNKKIKIFLRYCLKDQAPLCSVNILQHQNY